MTPWQRKEQIGEATLYLGDALACLRELPDESVHCIVTSPPYWGLRNYGIDGQLGLEKTPEEYVAKMVKVFREARRVLQKDGTLWLNMGDSYAGSWGNNGAREGKQREVNEVRYERHAWDDYVQRPPSSHRLPGLKPKDLCGIPWRVAFALQADGWYLRSDIIWAKPNPMPESCTDRPTKSHEYLFLLSKSARYFYDQEAIKEPMQDITYWRLTQPGFEQQTGGPKDPLDGNRSHRKTLNNQHERLISQEKWKTRFEGFEEWKKTNTGRNRRTVWTIATQPFPEAHFATFPEKLVEPCILAGCPAQVCPECGAPWERTIKRERIEHNGEVLSNKRDGGLTNQDGMDRTGMSHKKYSDWLADHPPHTLGFRPTCSCGREDTIPGTMLDPFCGAGTALLVGLRLNRRVIGIELKPEYMDMTRKRIAEEAAQGKLI